MLTWEDDVEVHALRKRGWTISAIARHTGRDRKTIADYLSGKRTPGVRARPDPDPFEPFVDYVTARLTEDPHLWARTLLDELEPLGFELSYQSLTRNIRERDLRPDCPACRTATERPNAVIPHAAGEETQWDWLELPNPPEAWGWGKTAHLLVGSLAHSGKWRAALSPSQDQPHLVAALDKVSRELGGVTRVWRFDRMATVCDPGSGRVSASFAGVAKHYGVAVAICPPRRGNRKGVVEKVNHTAAQRWWRTLADETTVEAAQASVDRFARVRGDTRLRATSEGRSSVAVVATTEPLAPVPAVPYPVIVSETRTASRQALVSYRGGPLLGAPGAGRRPGGGQPSHRGPVLRYRHGQRDRDRPAPAGRRRARCHGPRRRACPRPGHRGDGHGIHRASASPQGTHPTRASGQSCCRPTADATPGR